MFSPEDKQAKVITCLITFANIPESYIFFLWQTQTQEKKNQQSPGTTYTINMWD